MTPARHLTFAEGEQGLYHCIARCVRRAGLCGVDPITKVDYEHRKPMIAARIVQLAGIFAVDVYSYALMSNHLHVVLSIEPTASRDAFYRRIKSRAGAPKAITATAHKMARIYYAMVTRGENYQESGAKAYEDASRDRVLRQLKRRAQSLGYDLTPSESIT